MTTKLLVAAVVLTLPCYAAAQMLTNEDLEKKYGPSGSSSTQSEASKEDPCIVVNYNTFDDTKVHSTPTILNTTKKGSVLPGGHVYQSTTTYMSVSIKNNTQTMKRIVPSDIIVKTIKGTTSSPSGTEPVYINPGETKTIDGLKFSRGLPQATSVKCVCY